MASVAEPAGMSNDVPTWTDDLLKLATLTLNDSMWAPQNHAQRLEWQKRSQLRLKRYVKEPIAPAQAKPDSDIVSDTSSSNYVPPHLRTSKVESSGTIVIQPNLPSHFRGAHQIGQNREQTRPASERPQHTSPSHVANGMKTSPSTTSNSGSSSATSKQPVRLQEDEFLSFMRKKDKTAARPVSVTKPSGINIVPSTTSNSPSSPTPEQAPSSQEKYSASIMVKQENASSPGAFGVKTISSTTSNAASVSPDAKQAIKSQESQEDAFLAYLNKKKAPKADMPKRSIENSAPMMKQEKASSPGAFGVKTTSPTASNATAVSPDAKLAKKSQEDAFLAYMSKKKAPKAEMPKSVIRNFASGAQNDLNIQASNTLDGSQTITPEWISNDFVPVKPQPPHPAADAWRNAVLAKPGDEAGQAEKSFEAYLKEHTVKVPKQTFTEQTGTTNAKATPTTVVQAISRAESPPSLQNGFSAVQNGKQALADGQAAWAAMLQQSVAKNAAINKPVTCSPTAVKPSLKPEAMSSIASKQQPSHIASRQKGIIEPMRSQAIAIAATSGSSAASHASNHRAPHSVSTVKHAKPLPLFVETRVKFEPDPVGATSQCSQQIQVPLSGQGSGSLNDAWHINSKPARGEGTCLADVLLAEIKETQSPGVKLTEGALAATTGQAPRAWSIETLEDRVSALDAEPNPKEVVRAEQGKPAAEQMLDWDGKTWLPAPIDWENDRGRFDAQFVPSYIKEWSASVPGGDDVQVDLASEEFQLGVPLSNKVFMKTEYNFESFPNTAESENEAARLLQTSRTEAHRYKLKMDKAERLARKRAIQYAIHEQEIFSREPEPHPFAPLIDIYLRPADDNDAQEIAEIYNHYVDHSIIPEDQTKVTAAQIKYMIELARQDKIPFIVAVKGNLPNLQESSLNRSKKVILPQYEKILGFSLCESANYGFGGQRTGRSRYTAKLHLYVHYQYTRKRVGRSLLDRLIQTMSACYRAQDGYAWLNTNDDQHYNQGLGGRWHQVLFEYPVLHDDDPTFKWMKEFLVKFYFKDEARLIAVGRSSINQGPAKWLDTVYFQSEVSPAGEFDPFV